MKLELHATPDEVMRAVEALREFGRHCGISEKDLFGVALALEECGSNIVDHAFLRDARQTFRVAIEHTDGAIVVELRDRGAAFDPTTAAARPPLINGSHEIGGWGLQLVRRFVDEISYRREAGENVLRLSKRLKQSSSAK